MDVNLNLAKPVNFRAHCGQTGSERDLNIFMVMITSAVQSKRTVLAAAEFAANEVNVFMFVYLSSLYLQAQLRYGISN